MYSLFKNEIKTEEYILSNIPKYKRSLLCQLRISILPLEIETGRYTRKEVEDRICKLCKLDIEDEIHFVCVVLNFKLSAINIITKFVLVKMIVY